MRRIFLTASVLLICFSSIASHIIGGEFIYDYIGSNRYKITLKMYRDCAGPGPAFDSPAMVFVYNSTGTIVDTLAMAFKGSKKLPPNFNSICFTAPSNVCVEETVYFDSLTLPPSPGGYDITYQRCCRNSTILNIVNPGQVGITYTIHIPDQATIQNSSPRFSNFPPIFLCEGTPFNFDYSAIDPDSDSLVYVLCDPFEGADLTCSGPGMPSTIACPGNGITQPPPPPPPYYPLMWATNYSAGYPMDANPALTINPITGILNGTPTTLGQFIVGVCINEYRKNILIAVHRREFQFNVVNCQAQSTVSSPSQKTFCNGKTINFSNPSSGTYYHWDFGDNTIGGDTSNQQNPSYSYLDTGKYTVTLIVSPGSICADTAKIIAVAYDPITATFTSPVGQNITGNSFDFYSLGSFSANASFSWDFGSNATPPSSGLANPKGIIYNKAGAFAVKLNVTDNGCYAFHMDTVRILVDGINQVAINNSTMLLYPNPFNNQSYVNLELSEKGLVEIIVYNSLGQKISTLENNVLPKGNYKYEINIESKGAYFLSLSINGQQKSCRLMQVK